MPDGWLQDFDRFWTIVVEVWNYGVLGISLGRLITAAAILIVFLVTRRLFIRVVMRRIDGDRQDDRRMPKAFQPMREMAHGSGNPVWGLPAGPSRSQQSNLQGALLPDPMRCVFKARTTAYCYAFFKK